MTSIDLRDAEVQLHFTALRKAAKDEEKQQIAAQISKMYERSDQYSYGIFTRVIKFLSESNQKEEKKIGLIVLAALGPKMQGTARSLYVNKFHSPVFKLIETTQEESLIPDIENAYEIILQIGGNRNDSAVESNLTSCFAILQNSNSKDVRKIGAYAILRILVTTSPYITFKKLLQKQKSSNLDNLSLTIASAKVKNIKVRNAYLNFLVQYVKYIAEKKDHIFQKASFERFYEVYSHITPKDTNEQVNHLYLQTVNIFLLYLSNIVPIERVRLILAFCQQKIQINKNPVIEKSLIQQLPKLTQKKPADQVISNFLKYLRTIEGEGKNMSQQAINLILQTIPEKKQYFLSIYKDILAEILTKFKNLFGKNTSYLQVIELASVQIKTIDILIKKYENNYEALISRDDLDNLVSYAMLIRLDQQIIKLIADIGKNNIHNLGRVIQIKFIITISKILTGSTRKVLRESNQEFKSFLELLELKESADFLQNQPNKVRAIQALSHYRFREEFRDVVGGFVKDRVLKYYLQWGNSKMKMASVQAAFFLYAKKGKTVASNQLLQILDKLLRVGLTDADQNVREKVFMSICKNFKRHQQFLYFFNNISLLSYLFQAVQDRSESIRLWALRIICILHNKNPSVMITPFLKKITYNCFYHLSSNFKYYNHKKSLIESIVIIIELAPSIIEQHIDSLLKLLLNYLADRNNYEGLQLLFFDLIRKLAVVLPNSIVPYAESFSQHLVVAMKDKLNTKNRLIALKTFINIIRQCGYVVIPYIQINSLKDTLTFLIRSQIQEQSRNDIMRIIGALGAVDNLRYCMIINGCGQSKTPQNLIKSLNRLNSTSHFLKLRNNLLQQKQNNAIDKQLKLYYDQLILLQNNKKLMLLGKQQKLGSVNLDSQAAGEQKIQLQIDSSMNFHMIILKALFQILNDKSLLQKYSLTLDVLKELLEMMGGDLHRQLPKIMQILLKLVKTNQQILNLIYILGDKCDISQFVGQIVSYIIKQCKNVELIVKLLMLITAKYNQILRHLMQPIIDKLHHIIQNHFNQGQLMVQLSFIFQNIKNHLQPYLTIIIPQIMEKFFLKNSQTTNAFIDFLMNLSLCCSSVLQFMPLITYHFANLLNLCSNKHSDCKPCLRNKLCNSIVLFITIFKRQFISYLPLLHKAILKDQQIHSLYFKAVRYLQNCSFGNINNIFTEDQLQKIAPQYVNTFNHNKFQTPKYLKRIEGIQQLIHQFDPLGKKIVDEDWVEWLKKTSIFLLKKSPNILLRTCSVLADQYNQLGLELYNISFFHFWQILVDEQKKILIDNIKKILTYNPKPFLLVRKTFLNLAQFMNRKKCSFELSSSLLAQCAGQSSSFAKQLYYKQQQFEANPQKIVQSLIDTYMRLGEPENAYGLFSIANSLDIKCKIEWYQKIGRFQQAYKSYDQMRDRGMSIQRIKCLSHIQDQGFISQFQKISNNKMQYISTDIALLAVQSYAHLQKWDKCKQTLCKIQQNTVDQQFWTAILQVKKDQYNEAISHINNSRKLLYQQIPDLFNFSSSSQAFQKFISMQQLFQLQEIVLLKQNQLKMIESMKNMDEAQKMRNYKANKNTCDKLRQIWSDRLIGCSKNSNTYKKLSIVRSLLFNKAEYFQFYYQFCQIYIKQNKISKCQQLIKQIKSQLQKFSSEKQLKLLHLLQIKISFTNNMIKDIHQILQIQNFLQEYTSLHPHKIGQLYYQSALTLYDNQSVSQDSQNKILQLLGKSAKLCNSQKEWYILSIMNLQFADLNSQLAEKYIENALISLINSLKITTNQNEYYLQGYLKLLSVLCNHSKIDRICQIFEEQFKKIPVQGWINVVPQIIAQLYQVNEQSNFIKILKLLLKSLGKQHPQSVLFSLNFALKSKIQERTKPANQIIQYIKESHKQLAQQVQKISNELGRAAIKLKQYWYDGIESAWSIYNQNKNADQIVALLKQICQNVLNRKESNSQLAFHQQFGQEIRDGYNWLLRFQQNQEPTCISQVFQIFYSVYKKVKDSFQNIKKVYLKNVAPFLVTSKNYKSSIPGMYLPGKACVRINGFCNQLVILQSKQRPRKLTVYGDDGKQYNFLLKGRQDLRLDERVMQFFSLVNKLLAVERQNLKRDLQITRYSIIPLTVNTGLIGWVQNCDTLNQLIKEYRTLNKIRVYVEKELYEKMCPDYAYLPVINKLEIFKNGLESTQGKDLQKILWLKSPNSEVWVEKRNNYTCSLATMSMVGYILGLGDRHPSNIMLQRDSGKVVHIDFGDCFEVAVLREKFPQKVPFRLTRMLQKAMGIPGIHGLFRFTCEMVMKILRENKESLFGVLQTFAQDPIISWRLTNEKKEEGEKLKCQLKKNINDQIIGSIMEGLQLQINESKLVGKDGQTEMEDEHPRRIQQEAENKQQINEKAVKALDRVKQKLKGTDFDQNKQLAVQEQVAKLIQEATAAINICQSWPGWCPFW